LACRFPRIRLRPASFDGDGIPDLAASDGEFVSILLGNGDGTFQAPVSYKADAGFGTLLVADVTGSGKLDLVLGGYTIMLGNGDGTFQAPYLVQGLVGPIICVADFSGDGKPDLLTGGDTKSISVDLSNGDGTFQPPRTYALPGDFLSAAVGDSNGDGKPDVAVIWDDEDAATLLILLGDGDGTFKTGASYTDGYPGFYGGVIASDLNGDGALDLVVSGGFSTVTLILLGNGDGTFQPALSMNFPSADVLVADFNGDGKLDLAFISGFPGGALGNGDGTFQAPMYFAGGNGPEQVAVADFDLDGKPDLALAD